MTRVKLEKVVVVMHKAQAETVKELAKKDKRSLSSFCRIAIEEALSSRGLAE